ncbi:hypothetical protein [Agrobacterium cavarae]|uniref:hypothetical protein n=1 Tax=Agrobacterium cavarae TaxID=2528239 RepID=UPI00289FB38E|nr:hypothetical protein [Agrobacterium cavarae]
MNRTTYETPTARISWGADSGPPSEKSKKYQDVNRSPLKEIEHHPERSRCVNTRLINIIDQPCGTGKTTRMLSSFQEGEKYLVVVPLLSEVQRVVRDASVTFTQPETDEHGTKAAHLEALLRAGENIVTTHALYKDLAKLAAAGLLDDHHIFIDEVLDVVQPVPGPTSKSFQEFYLDKGYVFQRRDGLIIPTNKWDEDFSQVSDTLQSRLYRLARTRSLYRVDGEFFLWALPEVLLRAGKSMTVLTYLAEGSLMLAYMRRLEIPYRHERWPGDADFRNSVSELVSVRGLPSVEDPRKGKGVGCIEISIRLNQPPIVQFICRHVLLPSPFSSTRDRDVSSEQHSVRADRRCSPSCARPINSWRLQVAIQPRHTPSFALVMPRLCRPRK